MTNELSSNALSYRQEWDESYSRLENTLFYPSEEVVRFVNRYIRRRTGFATFSKHFDARPSIVDIGSGAGRHLAYLWESGLHPVGIELSGVACQQALEFMESKQAPRAEYDLINSSASQAGLADNSIDYGISVSTLDSMPTSVALDVVATLRSSLKPGGLFYSDLISNESMRAGLSLDDSDQLVAEVHERGTIQSYYNETKIRRLFAGFDMVRFETITRSNNEGAVLEKRWHIVVRKPA
ncbi:MAG: class I SAM-dependent methyltransferase [Devosia sp.]